MNISISATDILSISPMLMLVLTAFILIIIESFFETLSKKCAFSVALVGLIAALGFEFLNPKSINPLLTPWLKFDQTASFFTLLFILSGIGAALLSPPLFKRYSATSGEYYFLLVSSVFGLSLIASSADFLTLFLGLETLSISLYVMCGYTKKWSISREAAMKYFFLGALSSAFLLYGIALIYGAIGSTNFDTLLPSFQKLQNPSDKALFFFGIAFVTLGLCFKAAVVPFHTWAPDVYDGAPTPVTAFMAIGTKAGAFAALVRVFLEALPQFDPLWNQVIAWLAFPTLIYANFTAIRQLQLRRFFAYSGISHSGFLLMGLASGKEEAFLAIEFYLVVYALATIAAFAVLTFLDRKEEGVLLPDLRGLFRRSPWLATILALSLLTLAGIPPTAGFFAKFYIFKLAFQAGYHALVVVGLLTAVLGVFYYMRIVSLMLLEVGEDVKPLPRSIPVWVAGVFSTAMIVVLSIYPKGLMEWLSINP